MENTNHSTKNGNILTKAEMFFDKNKKVLSIAAIAIVVVVGGYFGIREFYVKPQNNRAAEEMFAAQNWMQLDSLDLALNGNGKHLGFVDVAGQYSSTKSGNLAKYCAGICFRKKGDFQKAIEYFESYKANDLLTGSLKEAGLGDCYLELNQLDEAVKHYEKSVKIHTNEATTPYAMMKLGLTYEMQNNFDKAVAIFKDLKKMYPMATEARDIDKHIAYAEAQISAK